MGGHYFSRFHGWLVYNAWVHVFFFPTAQCLSNISFDCDFPGHVASKRKTIDNEWLTDDMRVHRIDNDVLLRCACIMCGYIYFFPTAQCLGNISCDCDFPGNIAPKRTIDNELLTDNMRLHRIDDDVLLRCARRYGYTSVPK
jgi:hypothetical protein